MAANAGNSDNVNISLEAGIERPKHIVRIEQVNIVIDKDNMF